MTLATAIGLAAAGIACYVAVLSAQFSRAPGWRDQRYFSLAALAAAAYAVLDIPTTTPHFSDGAVLLVTRIQFGVCALHAFAWMRYSGVAVGRSRSAIDRVLVSVLAALSAGAALPGFYYSGLVRAHAFAPLGVVYRSPVTTLAGDVAYTLVMAALAVPMARFASAWRRGVHNAGVQFLALVFLVLLATSDLLVLSGVYSAPYLLDVAFLLPIAAVGYVLTSRFVEDARALQALREGLENQVAERTAELGRAQEALHRAEKLAALGQFATGVAHEVNNPAAVVSANLAYLAEAEGDALSEDGRNAVKESVQSVQRIAAIVRQLLDAGRLAASPDARATVLLKPLADQAISVARARFGKRVLVSNSVPGDLRAWGHEGMLAQVLANLVANAVQAVPDHRSDGHVVIGADSTADRVRLIVEDNGAGIAPEVLRRVFEPFFTTKPFGSGTGLGLAVSRGLIMSLGGDLRLDSEAGKGTRATIDLGRATVPDGAPTVERLPEQTPPARTRVLIIDDEPGVLSSLRRLLEPRYRIDVASGVDDALSRMGGGEAFDLVLCDLMMPGGGGERFYRAVLDRSPSAARRVVFLTGGAVTDAARQFLRNQPQPILYKPLELDHLARVADEICHPARAAARS